MSLSSMVVGLAHLGKVVGKPLGSICQARKPSGNSLSANSFAVFVDFLTDIGMTPA
jgi:hypothetical protein